MNGGPGCSSLDGALMEIGPFRLKSEDKVVTNEGSWHKYANLLFLDQPRGVGFSTSNTDSLTESMDEVSEDFLKFMDEFFEIFPDQLNSEFYIAGESFAGQYIPYLSKAILDRNRKLREKKNPDVGHDNDREDKNKIINLQGLLIGNGWIDPVHQYLQYLPFAYAHDLVKQGTEEANQLEKVHRECADTLSDLGTDNLTAHVETCERIAKTIIGISRAQDEDHCFNIYDIRLKDTYPSCGMNWPPDLEYITPYLRKPEVLKALNTYTHGSGGWRECSSSVHRAMNQDKTPPAINIIPELTSEVEITFFSGTQDFICNSMGTDSMLDNMEWNGVTGFGTDNKEQEWKLHGKSRGSVVSARNVSSVKFYDSSHMVPFDDSEATQFMLNVAAGLTTWEDNNNVSLSTGWGNQKENKEKEEIAQNATLSAYYRSGVVSLIVVLIVVGGFGYFLWKRENRDMYGPRRGFWSSIVGGLSRWKPRHRRTRSSKSGSGDFRLNSNEEGNYYGLRDRDRASGGITDEIILEEEEYELNERDGQRYNDDDDDEDNNILSASEDEHSSPEEVVVKRPEEQV